ncbi:MAG: YchJ family protein [Psychrobacter sp.]|nr:YchJ family protein [Psychrobacter sp. FME5]MDN5800929.1 YchJ family protein [Psychrobacter sp.]MDN5897527.1 YchJ family protein [Psychrobacter sp.]
MQTCPCQINPTSDNLSTLLAYKDCCQPYHDGINKADTAERLMRTRYSAFVLVKPDYIVATTVPAQQNFLDIKAIESWARETDWAGLEIVAHTPKLGKRHAQVDFKAYFNTPDGTQAHQELSSFVKVNERWYFLDPTVSMSVTQKQPCICGSGEKFKRCCGVYLS